MWGDITLLLKNEVHFDLNWHGKIHSLQLSEKNERLEWNISKYCSCLGSRMVGYFYLCFIVFLLFQIITVSLFSFWITAFWKVILWFWFWYFSIYWYKNIINCTFKLCNMDTLSLFMIWIFCSLKLLFLHLQGPQIKISSWAYIFLPHTSHVALIVCWLKTYTPSSSASCQ